MNIRDYDYIETRLVNPLDNTTEACGRLRQIGRDDLAARVMEAAKVFTDECRSVRREILGQRGTQF